MRPFAVWTVALTLLAPLLDAQWVAPQCDVQPGHFLVSGAVVHLHTAADKPTQAQSQLAAARTALVQAIVQNHQEKNAGAWYYLGRYYVAVSDLAGADTSFDHAEALAPQCKQDIATYRRQMGTAAMNQGLALWQGGNADSATGLLRQAYAVDPSSPKPLFQLGSLYASRNAFDSASAVLHRAAQAAGDDTLYREAKRDAFLAIARMAFRQAQADPAVQKWQHSQYSRDSIGPWIASDSSVVARVRQSSASRRARGARLSPPDQQTFARDSSGLEQTLAQHRAAQAALQQQAGSDSAAAQVAFAPAVAAYRDLVSSYPANVEAATTLASIYAQSGHRSDAAAAYDALLSHAADLTVVELEDLAQRLQTARMSAGAIKAYALVLDKNPLQRNALSSLATLYVAAKDTAHALGAAQRLVTIEPLNKTSLNLLGQAWDLRGRRDSAQRYTQLADTLAIDVTVVSLVADSAGATVTGFAANGRPAASSPRHLSFEFLDSRGGVVATQTVDIPAVPPGDSHQFEAHAVGKGIVGWRYRPS